MTLLQARALEIAVGDRLLTKDLDLQVDRGEFWCVLGKTVWVKRRYFKSLRVFVRPLKVRLSCAVIRCKARPWLSSHSAVG